jgi:hypothetical protein
MGLRSPGGEEDLPGFTREAPPMRRLRDPPDQEIRAGQHLGHFARVQGGAALRLRGRDGRSAGCEARFARGPAPRALWRARGLAHRGRASSGRRPTQTRRAELRAWERGGFFASSFDLREAVGGVLESAHAAPALEDRAAGAVRAFVARFREESFLELVDARQESSLVVDIVKSWTRRLRETIRGGT